MSHLRFREIDDELDSLGWWYSRQSRQFEAEGGRVVWQDIVVAIPDVSLEEWLAYEERKRSEQRRPAVIALCETASAR